jgi:hypothetical protein
MGGEGRVVGQPDTRCPSALTPVAINACTLTTRPSSRTFTVNASTQTNA